MTLPSINPRAEVEASSPEKWALLIGINNYLYAGQDGFAPLHGCLNDVSDMRELLIGKYGFAPDHIAVLTEGDATRQGILDCIRRHLVDLAKPGDVAVLYYSGHGSYCYDPVRIGNRDQTLVPYDGRDPEDKVDDITGRDLNEALQGLKTQHGIFILDSCYSGSMRARFAGRVRAIPPRLRARGSLQRSAVQNGNADASYVLLAASAPNEESIELEVAGRARGLFTYLLCRELRSSQANRTYRDLMDVIRPTVASYYPDQHPSLEGKSADVHVFGNIPVSTDFYVLASPLPSGEIQLDGGEELGLTSGSIYAVYPPDAKQLRAPHSPVATVQLTHVGKFQSSGKILQGGPVAPSSRAVENIHSYQQQKTRVRLEEDPKTGTADDLRRRLSSLPWVELVNDDTCQLLVTADESGWQVGRAGEPWRAKGIPHSPSAVDEILARLTRWMRWLNLLWLSNSSPSLALDFKVSVTEQTPAGATGGSVGCFIQNNSSSDLYLALLNLSDDGSITLVYPVHRASLLCAGKSVVENFNLKPVPSHQAPCREILKLFATTCPRDFTIFETDSIKPAPAVGDDLDLLLLAAALGNGLRATPVAGQDWIALERSFSYGSAAGALSMKGSHG